MPTPRCPNCKRAGTLNDGCPSCPGFWFTTDEPVCSPADLAAFIAAIPRERLDTTEPPTVDADKQLSGADAIELLGAAVSQAGLRPGLTEHEQREQDAYDKAMRPEPKPKKGR